MTSHGCGAYCILCDSMSSSSFHCCDWVAGSLLSGRRPIPVAHVFTPPSTSLLHPGATKGPAQFTRWEEHQVSSFQLTGAFMASSHPYSLQTLKWLRFWHQPKTQRTWRAGWRPAGGCTAKPWAPNPASWPEKVSCTQVYRLHIDMVLQYVWLPDKQ